MQLFRSRFVHYREKNEIYIYQQAPPVIFSADMGCSPAKHKATDYTVAPSNYTIKGQPIKYYK